MTGLRKLLLAGPVVVLLGLGAVALSGLLSENDDQVCPVDDALLCALALRLEKALQGGEIDLVLAQIAWEGTCDYVPGRTDCSGYADIYYLPLNTCLPAHISRCWKGDGASVPPELYRQNLERWLGRVGPVRLYGVGTKNDGSPGALLFTTDGLTEERRLEPSLLFMLEQRGTDYLIGGTVQIPRAVVLDGFEAYGSGPLTWVEWTR